MNYLKIGNFIGFQLIWFACILAASNDFYWPGFVVLVIAYLWQLFYQQINVLDPILMLIAGIFGMILDSLWLQTGLISYSANPWAPLAPPWILVLWLALGLTLKHSLSWMQSRLISASLLAAIAAPCSYFAAEKLSAITIHTDSSVSFYLLALSWALLIPLLLFIAKCLTREPIHA